MLRHWETERMATRRKARRWRHRRDRMVTRIVNDVVDEMAAGIAPKWLGIDHAKGRDGYGLHRWGLPSTGGGVIRGNNPKVVVVDEWAGLTDNKKDPAR